jgi:hypothetical protein
MLCSNRAESAYEYHQGPMEPPVDYDDFEREDQRFIAHDEESNSHYYRKPEKLGTPDDITSISNCYRSIDSEGDILMTADVTGSQDSATMVTSGSSSASSSIRNRSSCYQSYSLYGVGGSRFDSASVSQASTGNI